MDIKDAQEMMRRIYFERDRSRGINRTILRTFQELAELSDAVMSNAPHKEILGEFGDVFAWLCSLANLLDVDLTEALLSKYNNVCSRCGNSPCTCKETP